MRDSLLDKRRPRKLLLLVGSSPLPNYLAAKILRPSEEIVFLYSNETKDPYKRLNEHLKGAFKTDYIYIEDATDAKEIRQKCQNLGADHLHYSGGTKVMAAHARRVFGFDDDHASYINERKSVLQFDDGCTISLEMCDTLLGLSLDMMLGLHGFRGEEKERKDGEPQDSDVEVVGKAVLEKPSLAISLREHFYHDDTLRKFPREKGDPVFIADEKGLLGLGVNKVPDESWSVERRKSLCEGWAKFLTGGWLESWVASRVKSCLGDNNIPVNVNIECKRVEGHRLGAEFEIDVALIRGHRLYVISCTTDATPRLCKSKFFEVAMRSRQMGGDLVRHALVCMLPDEHAHLDMLQSTIESVWDSPNKPKVFGLRHLRQWAGIQASPDLASLKEWLLDS